MRVRTTPRVNAAQKLVVLDRPELVSAFEGFGAKVEVGLPFLRAAGVPLPPDVALTSLAVSSGEVTLEGELTVRPIDYETILATATELANAAAQASQERAPPDAVAVDRDDDFIDVDADRDGGEENYSKRFHCEFCACE